MKIACIGNMNNNFFALTRHLRDSGLDAELLLLSDEFAHFLPENDTFDLGYQEFTRRLEWGPKNRFLRVDPKVVRADLEPYDFLIGCGAVPAFCHRAGLRLDMFIPFGADIYSEPFFQLELSFRQLNLLSFSHCQRRGIGGCRYVFMEDTNPSYEALFLNIIKGSRIKSSPPMIYNPLYNPATIRDYYDCSNWRREFEKIKANHDFVIFHHSRLMWKDKALLIQRRDNEKLIYGFHEFMRINGNINPALILLEYGPDVAETRELINKLGIKNKVYWFPRMSRKEIMIGVSLADLVCTGELHHSYLTCGTVLEGLAMAKPLIHHREDRLYEANYPELYPLVNVSSAQDIAEGLNDYCARPDFYRQLGESGREWFLEHAIDRPLREIIGAINETRSD